MSNSLYSSVVALTVVIFMTGIFIYNQSQQDSSPDLNHKYIKKNDRIVSVPRHTLEGLLAKYRNQLINQAKTNTNINPALLRDIEKELASHVRVKYGITYNMDPIDQEKYISDQGAKQINSYDAELVGGSDISETGRGLVKIVWYLEQIMLQNRNNDNSVEVPLILEKMDMIVAVRPFAANRTVAANQSVAMNNSNIDYNVVDVLDQNELRMPSFKAAPKKCSSRLRNNLKNYISDSAGLEINGNETNQKAKNTQEATASWQKNNIFRMSDFSHDLENDFDDIETRQLHPSIVYAGDYSLPLRMMKQDRTRLNQKQSLTNMDDFDYLEQQFISN